MKHIDIEREANEYFSHNPAEKVVAFAMLDSIQLEQANNGEEIQGEVTILEVTVNDNVKEIIANEYRSKK
tara:strand:+ start:3589 stop:3798 length:210 start_codon:yes stop_codon:yes gene_type:complete